MYTGYILYCILYVCFAIANGYYQNVFQKNEPLTPKPLIMTESLSSHCVNSAVFLNIYPCSTLVMYCIHSSISVCVFD